MYQLIERLHAEAKYAALTTQFVEDGVLLRYQRTKYAKLHERIATLWDKFSAGTITLRELLKKCSHLNGASSSAVQDRASSERRSEDDATSCDRSRSFSDSVSGQTTSD